MANSRRILAAVWGVSMLAAPAAIAEEGLWVYARGVDTLPGGETELKLKTVTRIGKNSGDYRFTDIRPEIEYGITNRLTVSGELMIFDHNYSVDDPELQPMFDTQGGAGSTFRDTQIGGYEVAIKYNLLSVYQNPIGVSLGLGYEHRDKYRLDGADIDQDSVVFMAFFQKNFLDDTLSVVFSPKVELERRTSPGVLEEEIGLDWAAGISYRVAPNWFAGVEFRHQSDYLCPEEDGVCDPALQRSSWDFDNITVGSQHQNGNYFGPTVHYAQKEWWMTAGLLFQVFGGGSEFAYVKSGKNWDEHEKVHFGLSFGYEFGGE